MNYAREQTKESIVLDNVNYKVIMIHIICLF